nr:MAG TPA: hypothetical protein [Caudoviricetes sp.]
MGFLHLVLSTHLHIYSYYLRGNFFSCDPIFTHQPAF